MTKAAKHPLIEPADLKRMLASARPLPKPTTHVNGSGLKAYQYMVLVRPIEDSGEITFKSGLKIYKPDETRERDEHASMEGYVVDISPAAFTFEPSAPVPALGDRVVFARYSGTTIKGNDGVNYRYMNDKDIIGRRTEAA